MPRELAIALRARSTWLVAALAALLVGHGFVLALDLYAAASRSALASALSAQQMDPLAGLVRPTLGGTSLAISLLVPILAARPLSIEKERRSYGALCLQVGSSERVLLRKLGAALAASSLLLLTPLALLVAFAASGGHLDPLETAVALGGEACHLVLVTALGVAAAACTRTLAQAATLGIALSLTSWAIDAADGFAALAWLGGAAAWSMERRLTAFSSGVVSLGSVVWLLVATLGAVVVALAAGALGRSPLRRVAEPALIALAALALLASLAHTHRAWDLTQARRASLPSGVVAGLRSISAPVGLAVWLDRDDSRRRQLESDVIAKLWLARPDAEIDMPLDRASGGPELARDASYGRIVVRVGNASTETRSTSRRELVTLVFETARAPLPDWSQPAYPGFPFVPSPRGRSALVALAYFGLPLAFAALGLALTWRRTSR